MAFSKPPIKVIPGHPDNAYATRNGFAPEAVVLHIAEGSMAGLDSWFATGKDAKPPNPGAGAHFGVSKTGEIHQYYGLDQAPYANGIIEAGHTATLVDDNALANPNFWTVSIEHEGKSGDPVPTAQFASSTQLTAWLFDALLLTGGASGVAVDRTHVLRHGDISPLSRPRCPGWDEAFISRYIERVRTLLANPAPVPVPVDPRDTLIRQLQDALTMQERALRTEATTLTVQADNLAKLIKAGG